MLSKKFIALMTVAIQRVVMAQESTTGHCATRMRGPKAAVSPAARNWKRNFRPAPMALRSSHSPIAINPVAQSMMTARVCFTSPIPFRAGRIASGRRPGNNFATSNPPPRTAIHAIHIARPPATGVGLVWFLWCSDCGLSQSSNRGATTLRAKGVKHSDRTAEPPKANR